MKLVEFSVTNYRSITVAHKINLDNLTVLVGKNNEGKSNLLKALNVAMTAMILHAKKDEGLRFRRYPIYNWETDFPIQFQSRTKSLDSIFRLNFRLDEQEIIDFHKETGIRGNEDVPIEIRIGKYDQVKVSVPKKGSAAFKKKSDIITRFISSRISFNYIPAIRTENMAVNALNDAIVDELEALSSNSTYVKAQKTIASLEQKVLNKISKQITSPLRVFLPDLKKINIIQSSNSFTRFRANFDVIVDDGLATNISNKGDGIKSLITMAILQDKRKKTGASIIAIEEPESHLHPGAIHSLVDVINKMAGNNQVIISTHNPLFVRQNKISSNVIVHQGKARAARNINEIRELLGVIPSDNLLYARYILLVEGESDKNGLTKILSSKSGMIKEQLDNNQLVIKPLTGASNLSHDLEELKRNMCQYVVLLDHDKAGIEAAEKAINKGLLKESELRYVVCKGMPESEFEDCIRTAIYKDKVLNTYGVDINEKVFKSKQKWSERMKNGFVENGLRWTDQIENSLKIMISESIPENAASIDSVLIKEKAGFISGLVSLIERMIMKSF